MVTKINTKNNAGVNLKYIAILSISLLVCSASVFYLENGRATILCDKKPENLSEISYENKQNKLRLSKHP